MNFFLKGDFKLAPSWEEKPPSRSSKSRNKSRQSQNRSLVNAGKNIIAQPSTDLIDQELSKRILKEFADEKPPPASIRSNKKISPKEDSGYKMPPKQKNVSGSQNDLLTSMASRLKNVEMTCKNQRNEIKDKTDQVDKLKAQNQFLKGFREDATKEYDKMKDLQNQNDDLKQKIAEMEVYLKKYGLKWVGNKLQGKLQHQKMKKAIKSNHLQYRLPSEIDINTIMRRVEELNAGLQSEGMGTEVYQQKGIHKFKKAQPLPMGFFSNGIAIKGFRFFPYKSKESLQILGDLVDGYFPYVLKGKYPNGVFIKVTDKIAEKYDDESSTEAINTFDSKQNNQFKPPSKQEFLNKLPKQVVKNGKIINIRGEIEKKFNGEENQPINEVVEEEEENEHFTKEEGVTVFKTKENRELQNKLISQMDICTLKIRNQNGEVYILHLARTEVVKEIYFWMKKVSKQSFVLMSNYPKRSYQHDQTQHLQNLGFFPNAMLHIHSKK